MSNAGNRCDRVDKRMNNADNRCDRVGCNVL